jgi:chemosensory pili system protein ChpA (sensor histidine kinase/response regulator)
MSQPPVKAGEAATGGPTDEGGTNLLADELAGWDPADARVLRALFLDEAEGHLQRIAEAYVQLSTGGATHLETVAPADALMRALHALKGAAGSVGHDAIADATHEFEGLCADIRAGALAPTPGILERVEDNLATLRALIEGARHAPDREVRATLPSPPPSIAPSSPTDLNERRRRIDRRMTWDRRGHERGVRVDSERLDNILDAAGDLVILRTRIEKRVGELESLRRDLQGARGGLRRSLALLGATAPAEASVTALRPKAAAGSARAMARLADLELELATALAHMDRATQGLVGETEALRRGGEQLAEEVRRARLVPLDWVYHRLDAALRELEVVVGIQAQLFTSEGALEVDKSLIEQLYDPLLQLVRNCVAHGLEPPAERAAAGKPERGEVRIGARLEGDELYLTVEDDGRGVDSEVIRRRLVELGRLAPDAPFSDEDAQHAIFEPGFSTRPTADATAGRGVGLDVVRSAVVRMGGEVTVESKPGAWTRFKIFVPLATAITEAMLFKVGGQVYALPAANVVEALPPAAGDPTGALLGSHHQTPGGQRLPVLRLQSLLGVESPPDHRAAALMVKHGDRSFVLTCDRLIGTRTIVVRGLGPLLGLVPYFAGATVSGGGKAQLVLDAAALAEAAGGPARPPMAPSRRGPPRVLVVDDSRLAREAAARALASAGLHAVIAEDGMEAWELLNERRFDALITDLEMPRVDGFQLIGRIRRESTLRGLPIVVLSSRTSNAVREKALRLGADAVVAKAPQRRNLTQALWALLAERQIATPSPPTR